MIVAIIRGFEPDVCLRLAEAYYKGGINMVEVTFNQKYPRTWKDTAAAIKAIKDTFNDSVMVGAGTVLTEEQLKICEDAGGEFMVTPNMNASLIRKCVADGLMAMPGALTPTEAVEAYNAGAKYVKIFPAGVLGPGYIKAITAPLSHIPFLAVGGISPDNIADFIKAGCAGAGVGGNLTNKEWIKAGEWDKIAAVARSLVENSKFD
ncbi:MAG TPA: bifunctional 4-hydroxy-2-oxoglutarate aldolase/2-dehydro-3-deoxy-phosphogluconate aldolase [Candidatus Cryptobacteroides intestinipullorum]|nr:bifunctional 4-hydroxy-2-oxoglutarate aldolase/2-dehydro-3-deoxy-phosphogluconate aldolase [Candidatus Cryptobacteroides intestinipullorum]